MLFSCYSIIIYSIENIFLSLKYISMFIKCNQKISKNLVYYLECIKAMQTLAQLHRVSQIFLNGLY